ncbi:MAG: hypothetical protein E7207_04680 [Clostridium butyricum]|nr:hypothetical protein [Clostridium butyricum]
MKENLVRKLKKKVSECTDKSINRQNKKLIVDKILAYSPELLEGIEKYKDANRNFMLVMFFSIILISFPLISMPCCIASVVFLIKMLQFIKYRNINSIVNILGKDLAYKGIYDKGKIQGLIEDFKDKYGEDVVEYEKLVYMVDKYETFITKIEYLITKMKTYKPTSVVEEPAKCNIEQNNSNNDGYFKNKVKDYCKDINGKFSFVYKNEDGEIKKINRAIEFFDNENKDGEKTDAVVLKSNRHGKDDKLTVYLYKKSSDLQQNNAL